MELLGQFLKTGFINTPILLIKDESYFYISKNLIKQIISARKNLLIILSDASFRSILPDIPDLEVILVPSTISSDQFFYYIVDILEKSLQNKSVIVFDSSVGFLTPKFQIHSFVNLLDKYNDFKETLFLIFNKRALSMQVSAAIEEVCKSTLTLSTLNRNDDPMEILNYQTPELLYKQDIKMILSIYYKQRDKWLIERHTGHINNNNKLEITKPLPLTQNIEKTNANQIATFNTALTANQKKAKDNIDLPFLHAQIETTIEYHEELDEEDPDDDLEI